MLRALEQNFVVDIYLDRFYKCSVSQLFPYAMHETPTK
jgi:hypothetical protein